MPRRVPLRARTLRKVRLPTWTLRGVGLRTRTPRRVPLYARTPHRVCLHAGTPCGVGLRVRAPRWVPLHTGRLRKVRLPTWTLHGVGLRARAPRRVRLHARTPRGVALHAGTLRGVGLRARAPRRVPLHTGTLRGVALHARMARRARLHAGKPRGARLHTGTLRRVSLHTRPPCKARLSARAPYRIPRVRVRAAGTVPRGWGGPGAGEPRGTRAPRRALGRPVRGRPALPGGWRRRCEVVGGGGVGLVVACGGQRNIVLVVVPGRRTGRGAVRFAVGPGGPGCAVPGGPGAGRCGGRGLGRVLGGFGVRPGRRRLGGTRWDRGVLRFRAHAPPVSSRPGRLPVRGPSSVRSTGRRRVSPSRGTHTRTSGPASVGTVCGRRRSAVRARHSTGCRCRFGNQSTSPGDLPGTSPYPAVILSGRLRS